MRDADLGGGPYQAGQPGMSALMTPTSIAVVGASQRASRGSRVLVNLQQTGFQGEVFAINPRYDEVLGFPCYPSVKEVPSHVDCVVIAIPAAGATDVLAEAYLSGSRAAVVLSSGFGEGGHADHDRIDRLRELAAEGMSICGPNCYGVLNVKTGAAAFSGPTTGLLAGPVAVVSQSGGFSTIISTPLMEDRSVGCSYIVSCGNQIGVSIEDYLEYLVEDEDTTVIAAFVEGFRRPDRLPAIAERARALDKPIVVLKSGRSDAGRAAVMSHTGSLAGSPEILSALLRRSGIVQVETMDQLVETAAMLATLRSRRTPGRGLIVVTGSGGESSHSADAADAVGLAMPELAAETASRIERLLPDFGVAGNPVDGTGAMFENPDLFPALLEAVLDDPQDSVIAINLGGREPRTEYAPMRRFAEAIAAASTTTDKVIIGYGTSALGPPDRQMIGVLHDAGVPFVANTESAVRAISSLWSYRQYRERVASADRSAPAHLATADLPGGILPFLQARSLLLEFGIPIVETSLATTPDEAVAAAELIGYPVVLKAEAVGLVHKSDVGGVVVGCTDRTTVASAFARITESVRAGGFDEITGVLVQPMPVLAVETVAGVVVDPHLGPAVLFGLGGVFVELIRDTVTDIPPFSHEDARSMILRIRANEILRGARGTQPADIDALASVIVGLGDFAVAYQHRLRSVDLNPIFVGPQGEGAVAVDALVELSDVS